MDSTVLAITAAEARPVVAASVIDTSTNTVESELPRSFTKKLGAARSSRPCAGSEAVLCWGVRTRKDDAGAENQLLPRWVEE